MNRDYVLLSRAGVITVGGPDSCFPGFTSLAIQSAIDEASKQGGGIVKLDKGTFEITGPIRLIDRLTFTGAGPETILRKSDGVRSRFTVDADYGELRVEVADGSGFRVGMGIQIYDESQQWGWAESKATITSIDRNVLHFDRYLVRDYNSDDGGTVTNACSIIEGVEVEHVKICNLTIQGNKEANWPTGGCRAGGIYLHKVNNCLIEHVTVEDFHGDGISWQITEDISLYRCVVRGCTGSGLHPGSGSLYTRVNECDCSDNGKSGLFICWRVQHGEFTRNTFARNGDNGISIGHKDSDNRFSHNVISDNAVSGIYFRPEKTSNGANRNVWTNNIIENNGNEEVGYGIYVNGASADNEFKHNVIRDTGVQRQKTAIWLAEDVAGFNLAEDIAQNVRGKVEEA
ncbi:right-handed parallel beta-helix repeat-containing protein [Cohnella silvisoli]|uniref:Right-handed parallel beta-helix repeat-containing protein n=1 Tax=Cohnella silvisoli TaxID=2873699 RepID=A0ABV1KLW7_9BACL|nr:right-handed parallel beta-helix repeat-containing protein [Cohnella silvisoli]MCD9020851.1 right-handed parallel beta-helix repeat-containing protein [Cohnella silvisoli]